MTTSFLDLVPQTFCKSEIFIRFLVVFLHENILRMEIRELLQKNSPTRVNLNNPARPLTESGTMNSHWPRAYRNSRGPHGIN